MEQKDFRRLLKKYKKGHCTPEERTYVERWYANLASVDREQIGASERESIKQLSWKQLEVYIGSEDNDVTMETQAAKQAPRYAVYAIAASLTLVFVTFLFFLNQNDQHESQRTIANNTDKVSEVVLEDGSAVYLQPQSSLSYSQPFDDSLRSVTLEGEAFFEISRDTLRPFFVYTNDIITKVLGTSFTVTAFKGSPQIIVAVKTGKVSVIGRGSPGGSWEHLKETILTPNQKVVYDKRKHAVTKALVEEPQPIVPEGHVARMHFERAPVSKIFAGLEKVYGVNIEFDPETFQSCILTTTVAEGSIRTSLDMICKAINASYSFDKDKIVITGNGCISK